MDTLEQTKSLALRLANWTYQQKDAYAVARRPSRVPEVNELRQELRQLGVKEFRYFEEGLDCIEYAQASRAAIVLGWTGFVDLLQLKLQKDSFTALNGILKTDFHGVHKRCAQLKTRDDLIRHFDDALLLEAARKVGFYKSHVFKQLDAMRDERNNCAHVEEYAVTPRVALGYYARLFTFLPYAI